MKRQRVISSSIRSVGYDSANQIMEIEFQSGGIYCYYGVPREVYQELLNAPSKGRYFEANVRGTYRYARAA